VLLPVFVLVRRADMVEVVGAAIAARAWDPCTESPFLNRIDQAIATQTMAVQKALSWRLRRSWPAQVHGSWLRNLSCGATPDAGPHDCQHQAPNLFVALVSSRRFS
jgi:hypothetical protein